MSSNDAYAAAMAEGAAVRRKLRDAAREALEAIEKVELSANGRALTPNQSAGIARAREDYAFAASSLGLPVSVSQAERRELIERLERPDKLEDEAARVQRVAAALTSPEVRNRTMAMSGYFNAARSGTLGEGRIFLDKFALAARGVPSYFDSSTSAGFLERRDLTSVAGTTAPQTFADFLVAYERTAEPIFQLATTIDAGVGASYTIPRLTSDPSSGGTVTAEAAGITTGDSTFSAVSLPFYKYGHMSLWSNELAEDTTLNLDQMVAESAARQLVLDAGAHLTTGNGSGQPQGYVGSAQNGGTANGTVGGAASWNFIDPPALSDLTFAVAAPYRRNGAFIVSTTAYKAILKFRDSQNRPLLANAPFVGAPSQLFGYPIFESPSLAALGSASTSVVFGDFSKFYIVRKATRIDLSSEYKMGNDQIACRVIERLNGQLVDAKAAAFLVSANT